MATLVMVDGFGADGFMPLLKIVTDWQAENPDGQIVQFTYPNDQSDYANIQAAATNLQTLLLSLVANGPITVVTISMGGSVASELLRRWHALPGHVGPVAPADVNFILLANPERKYNGAAQLNASFMPGTPFVVRYAEPPGISDDTEYTVIDCTRQYDPIGDFPDLPNPSSNLLSQLFLGLFMIHNFYFEVTLDAEDNVSWTEGNITYILSRTYPVAMATIYFYSPDQMAETDVILREDFERFYTRYDEMGEPAALPEIDTSPPEIGYFPPQIPVSGDAIDRRIYLEAA